MHSRIATTAIRAANSTPTTCMPFLYQTRTLSSIRSLPSINSIFNSKTSRTRRCLHASANCSFQHPRALTTDEHSSTKTAIKEQPSQINNQQFQAEFETDEVPWEQFGKDLGNDALREATARASFVPDEPNDLDFVPEFDNFESKEEAFNEELGDEESRPRKRKKDSTITIAERDAFQRIFADIMARTKKQESRNPWDDISLTQVESSEVIGDRLSDIMNGAIQSSKNARKYEKANRLESDEDKRAAIEMYPQALRSAAAKAIGLNKLDSVLDLTRMAAKQEFTEQEARRKPERDRVEAKMRAAKTDVELWKVMEEEVFGMISKFGFTQKPVVGDQKLIPRKTAKKPKKAKATVPSTDLLVGDEEQPATWPANIKSPQLDLPLYGPLYPAFLLLGLRLLDRNFARPSPLALNILPRVKSLGVISHVLGASTALYNELLTIYWFRYDNLAATAQLLGEMEQAGLDHDDETLSVVTDICKFIARHRVRNAKPETPLENLWMMPNFNGARIRDWRYKIQSNIEAQEQFQLK
jgi:hypothetical protein